MRIGIMELRLNLPGVHSLKQKRGIVKSLLAQSRNRFQVAAAEVAHQDHWRTAGLGFALVGNDASLLQSRLAKLLDFIENGGQGVVADYQVEILP